MSRSRLINYAIALIFFFGFLSKAFTQEPTVQDCKGAIPVCQDIYKEPNVFSGDGNYHDEIPVCSPCNTCCPDNCLDGEQNSVWYRFTVQESGLLRLKILPNEASDDYDWALYDMTMHRCEDIKEKADKMQESCNAAGGSGYQGNTGIRTESGGTGDCHNCGPTNKWNADLQVKEGTTYILVLNNWQGAGAQSGFTLDFSESTAVIYDDVRPELTSVAYYEITCADSTFSFNFSEYVYCSSVTKECFALTGPDGEHEILKVEGENCLEGGETEKTFTATVDPPFTTTGDYTFSIVPFSSIKDACDNIAKPQDKDFYLDLEGPEIDESDLTITNSTCGDSNGSITGLEVSGSGPVEYLWTNESGDTVGYDVDLLDVPAGQYLFYATDTSHCKSTAGPYTVADEGGPVTDTSSMEIIPSTCDLANGRISGIELTGNPPFEYIWFDENNQQVGDDIDLVNVYSGEYKLRIIDANECSVIIGPFEVDDYPAPQINDIDIDIVPSTCNQPNGSILGLIISGNSQLTYEWIDIESGETVGNEENLTDVPPGEYQITVTDTLGCQSIAGPYEVTSIGGAAIEELFKEDATCELANGSIIINTSGGAGEVEFSIDDGANWKYGNIFAGLSPGTYNIMVKDTMCITDYVNNPVILENQGEAIDLNPSTNAPICSGDTLILASGIDDANYVWIGPEGFTSDQQTALLENATVSASGTYQLIVITDPYNCTDTATLDVEVMENVPIDVNITSTKNPIYPGEEVTFTATSSYSNNAVYEWIVNGEILQTGSDSTYTTTDIKSTSEIECRVYVELECAVPNPSTSNMLTLEVLAVKFYLPNSFRPGSTQGNDKFRVYTNSVNIPDFTLYVYDRWGKQIYESDNIEEGWDGTYNGKPMPAGVYVWVLAYTIYDTDTGQGQAEKKKGTILLLR